MTTEHRRNYIAKYNLNRYNQRMADAIAILGGACVVCGATEDLQLDHLNPSTKKFNLGKLWSTNLENFLEELTKCQLLCFTCHQLKTVIYDKHQTSHIGEEPRQPRPKQGVLKQ